MENYTGHYINMANLLDSKSSFSNNKRYFERFLADFNLKKISDTRANVCNDTNGKKIYFAGAEHTYWWGFSKKVIQTKSVDYLIARATENGQEFFVVITVQDSTTDGTGRVIVSAGGTGKDFWVNFGDGNYKISDTETNVFRTDAHNKKVYLGKEDK